MRHLPGREGAVTRRRESGRTASSRPRVLATGCALLLAASSFSCATKGQVRLLQGEISSLRIETARRDSVRAAALAAIIGLQQRIFDSLAAGREALRNFDVRIQADLTGVQRQLLQVQELTGQSQSRLSELKAQLDQRAEQAEVAGMTRPTAASPGDSMAGPAAPVPTADQMYQAARLQLNRGAAATARRGFQELIRVHQSHELVPEALFYIGDSFASGAPDSAVVYYTQVVDRFPQAAKASTSLYRLGRLESGRNNRAAARAYYDRLIKEYPRSDEVELARDALKNLRP